MDDKDKKELGLPIIDRDTTALEKIGLAALGVLSGLVAVFGFTKTGRAIVGGVLTGGAGIAGAKLIKNNWN